MENGYVSTFTGICPEKLAYGRGHHKTASQRYYDELCGYIRKLKNYAKHIKKRGENRNSYSKTDPDATFMRMKRDYMGNDQLLPGFNVQFGVCDEYISVFDIQQFASDMDCFKPLMERFFEWYSFYPEYPVADAGYGSYNNYLYCKEHRMKKYMKFTLFQKESKDVKYRDDPYRSVNFPVDGEGCSHRERCHKSKDNRVIRVNEELTEFHREVLENLNSVHGALLRMNRSIQAEGSFGAIKWDRSYSRACRRGLKVLFLEIGMICCGFNLHKFHLKKRAMKLAS